MFRHGVAKKQEGFAAEKRGKGGYAEMIFLKGRISHEYTNDFWIRRLGSCRNEPSTSHKKILSKLMNRICIYLLFTFRHEGTKAQRNTKEECLRFHVVGTATPTFETLNL